MFFSVHSCLWFLVFGFCISFFSIIYIYIYILLCCLLPFFFLLFSLDVHLVMDIERVKLLKEVEKAKEELCLANKKLYEENLLKEKLEQKVIISEQRVKAQEREIVLLQRQLKDAAVRGDVKVPSRGKSTIFNSSSSSDLEKENNFLKEECKELRNAVGQLKKMVSILKKQKILLEGGLALSLKEKDIEHLLEIYS